MSKTHGTSPIGGCPSLKDQAKNRHAEAETRIDIEMGKLGLDAIKKFKAMFKDWDNLKENTKLVLIEKVFKYNKDFIKEQRELLLANDTEQEYEEEDEEISICLTAEPTPETSKLN